MRNDTDNPPTKSRHPALLFLFISFQRANSRVAARYPISEVINLFEPDFNSVKESLQERFKPTDPKNPFEELIAVQNKFAVEVAEKMLLEYHRQLWAELQRQGAIK